jgi:hypothetical protein
MTSSDSASNGGLAGPRGCGGHASQRFGHVTGHTAGADDPSGQRDGYRVRDDETGLTYSFGGEDIVTEGFRAVRDGERVRFLIDHARPGRATYVIRLDQPDIEEYYT